MPARGTKRVLRGRVIYAYAGPGKRRPEQLMLRSRQDSQNQHPVVKGMLCISGIFT
jgi:hypothetical protein